MRSKKYAICYNSNLENSDALAAKIELELKKFNASYTILNIDDLKSDVDFAFVIGGDGSILKTARFYSQYSIPIFGFNTGHLGFLSQAGEHNIEETITKIFSGDYKTEKRIMLKSGDYCALNDFVIKGENSSRAVSFCLKIDNRFVCEYFADGIIISTPTGSTAYGMAAGGPIVVPEVEALTIVPICPHTFSARPIIVPSNSSIKIIGKENSKYVACADGQETFCFEREVEISQSSNKAHLALLNDNDFYKVLKNKLHWGYTPYSCK